MIQANELRIGNLINNKNSTCTVCGILNNTDLFVSNDWEEWYPLIDECEPIKLTEEWLLKLGFEKKNKFDFDLGKLRICMYDDRFPKGRVYFNSWAIIDENLKNVHQLQNLYFALTGQELRTKN